MLGLQHSLDQKLLAMCTICLCSAKIISTSHTIPTKGINLLPIRTRPNCKNSGEYFIIPLSTVWISPIGFVRGQWF